jgi:hypothetical protein
LTTRLKFRFTGRHVCDALPTTYLLRRRSSVGWRSAGWLFLACRLMEPRKPVGLASKQFHVTISQGTGTSGENERYHQVDKGLLSLVGGDETVIRAFERMSKDGMDQVQALEKTRIVRQPFPSDVVQIMLEVLPFPSASGLIPAACLSPCFLPMFYQVDVQPEPLRFQSVLFFTKLRFVSCLCYRSCFLFLFSKFLDRWKWVMDRCRTSMKDSYLFSGSLTNQASFAPTFNR